MSASTARLVDNPVQGHGAAPSSTIHPSSADDLQATVREAADRGAALVPLSSTGTHARTGLCCDHGHRAVDLSAWKDIPFISRRNRVVQIEPGVTWGELQRTLGAHGMAAPMPLSPRAGKSVVASLCERAPVTWPNKQWDTVDPMACMAFLFGSGELYVTGAAGGPGTLEQQRRVGQAQKAPLGPGATDFHRLVQGSQGSFGIALWLTVRAELAPSVERPLLVGVDTLPQLFDFVYAVQRIKLGEECYILDRVAAAMLLARTDAARFATLLESLPAWLLLQNIAGFERLPHERLRYQTDDVMRHATAAALRPAEALRDLTARDLLTAGRNDASPSDWRRDLRGQCLSLTFQCTLDRSAQLIGIARAAGRSLGLADDAIGAYVQPIVQTRFCEVELLMPYAATDEAAIARLRTFECEAFTALATAGAFFSRPYGYAERAVFAHNTNNTEFLRRLKRLFDPANILNPGKFGLVSC